METAVASVIVFLGYSFLMFQAGYQWCRWGRTGSGVDAARDEHAQDSKAVWNGMVGKI